MSHMVAAVNNPRIPLNGSTSYAMPSGGGHPPNLYIIGELRSNTVINIL